MPNSMEKPSRADEFETLPTNLQEKIVMKKLRAKKKKANKEEEDENSSILVLPKYAYVELASKYVTGKPKVNLPLSALESFNIRRTTRFGINKLLKSFHSAAQGGSNKSGLGFIRDYFFVVKPKPTDKEKYLVISGNHRLAAMRETDAPPQDWPCVVLPPTITDEELRILANGINFYGQDASVSMGDYEKLIHLGDLAMSMGFLDQMNWAKLYEHLVTFLCQLQPFRMKSSFLKELPVGLGQCTATC